MGRSLTVLPEPERPSSLNNDAQWLAGEGAGSWFVLDYLEQKKRYAINRYSPEGHLECRGQFESESLVDLTRQYILTYPSHCQQVNVIQGGMQIELRRITD